MIYICRLVVSLKEKSGGSQGGGGQNGQLPPTPYTGTICLASWEIRANFASVYIRGGGSPHPLPPTVDPPLEAIRGW